MMADDDPIPDTPPVPGYPGFVAGTDGLVWCKGRQISGYYDANGDVWINGVLRAVLICSAFNGPAPTEDATVTHIDGVNDNDVPTNLEWAAAE